MEFQSPLYPGESRRIVYVVVADDTGAAIIQYFKPVHDVYKKKLKAGKSAEIKIKQQRGRLTVAEKGISSMRPVIVSDVVKKNAPPLPSFPGNLPTDVPKTLTGNVVQVNYVMLCVDFIIFYFGKFYVFTLIIWNLSFVKCWYIKYIWHC